MMGAVSTFWRARDWSAAFWTFALRFYTMPRFAWRWMEYSRDAQPTPAWSRVLAVVMGYARVAFLGAWVLFLASLTGTAPVWLVIGVAAGVIVSIANLVLRAQAMYLRYGGTGARS